MLHRRVRSPGARSFTRFSTDTTTQEKVTYLACGVDAENPCLAFFPHERGHPQLLARPGERSQSVVLWGLFFDFPLAEVLEYSYHIVSLDLDTDLAARRPRKC
jgi:hypothetical protein